MALQCNMTVNYTAYQAGQTPPPMATLQVYNPNASAIAVTGIVLTYFDALGNPIAAPTNAPMPAMGPGQTVVAPALSSITFGPFPLVFGAAANMNSFQEMASADVTANTNNSAALPPQVLVRVGATVTASDGSLNTAGVAPINVSYTSAPPPAFQGGYLQFNSGKNLINGVL